MANMLKSALHKRTLLTVLFSLIGWGGCLVVAVPPASAQPDEILIREARDRTYQHSVRVGEATNCNNGELLASQQVQAENKGSVLKSLGQAASGMRAKLGESLATLQKFDAPVLVGKFPAPRTCSLAHQASVPSGEEGRAPAGREEC